MPGVRVTVPSVAHLVRIFPAVDLPMLARSARSFALRFGLAAYACQSLSSVSVRALVAVPSSVECCRLLFGWTRTPRLLPVRLLAMASASMLSVVMGTTWDRGSGNVWRRAGPYGRVLRARSQARMR